MVRTHLRPPEKTRSGRILVLVRPFPESQREPPVHAPGGKGAPRAGGQHHHRSVGRPAPTAGTTGIAGACMAVSLMAAGAFRNWAGRHGRTGGGRIASAGHRHSIYPRHWHTAGHRWVPSTSGGRSRTFARAPGSAGTGRPGDLRHVRLAVVCQWEAVEKIARLAGRPAVYLGRRRPTAVI